MSRYLDRLLLADKIRESALREAILALELPPASTGCDAGCGCGRHTLWLADEVGPEGRVTGVDRNTEFLEHARRAAGKAAAGDRVTYLRGDIGELPFDDGSFDWIWSADTLWPGTVIPADDPASAIRELARVVKPGGLVAVLFWSSQMLLPGYPALESRLCGTTAGLAPFTPEMEPESHCLLAAGWLREAGLRDISADSFISGFYAPLHRETREALLMTFGMRWEESEADLSERDRELYRSLTSPDSAECILDRPDYYSFVTYVMFRGVVSGRSRAGEMR